VTGIIVRLRLTWRRIEPLASVLAAAVLIALLVWALRDTGARPPATLQPHPANPRYFADNAGRALYLTGSHNWASLVDIDRIYPPKPFDFDAYLDLLERHEHTFIRLWTFEQPQWSLRDGTVLHVSPQPWLRTGPGRALDGRLKFNLTRFNPEYFRRLRTRVLAAATRGMYVSVMLFEGWELQFSPRPYNWRTHPFNGANNVNGIDGDLDGDGSGIEIHTLASPGVTAIQETYVRRVVDAVQDLDNVLFEIANESGPYSTEWQYSMIDLIKTYENENGERRHPVGMTFQWVGGDDAVLLESEADWISPRGDNSLDDPAVADGRKVILFDTDHICGVCSGESFVWRSFFRGHNPIYMDPLTGDNPVHRDPNAEYSYEQARSAMTQTLRLAGQIDLARMKPRPDLTTTRYALAEPGQTYLVYQPSSGLFSVDLRETEGTFVGRWLDLATGEWRPGKTVTGGAWVDIDPPVDRRVVLRLARATRAGTG
jgi:hypothetical protein